MSNKRSLLVVGAAFFGIALSTLAYCYSFLFRKKPQPQKLTTNDERTGEELTTATTNPNKTLLIGCGGFLD